MSVVTTKNKIKSILISQPEPGAKSPYFGIGEKYNVRFDFEPFITVEGVTIKEFRKSRVNMNDYACVIFTSRNSMDYFFNMCAELRVHMSQETKYFCISETIALYLQKHIQYRKRKVFYGDGTVKSLNELMLKYKDSGKFLYPCSEVRKGHIPKFLEDNGFDYKEGVLYRTVAADLKSIDMGKYDMLVFFSPSGVKSLFHNFPNYKQGKTSIAAFGPTTCKAVEQAGLELSVKAPNEQFRSMSKAIEFYLSDM